MRLSLEEYTRLAQNTARKLPNPLVDDEPESQSMTLGYPPSTNKYWRPVIVDGRATLVLGNAAKEYKQDTANRGMIAKVRLMSGPVSLTAVLYRARRNSDSDNVFKAVCDSLQGVLIHNDDQITEVHAYRRDDPKNPRIEICVKKIEQVK